MKANKAKSRFVYPDKLYARTNNNITLDISYAPQTLEAVEYTRTDAFIGKAFEFFGEHLWEYIDVKNANCDTFINIDGDKLKEDFKNYMEGK